MHQDIHSNFKKIYDNSFKKTAGFIASKCDNLSHLEDILQEVYTDVFYTINKRGIGYIKNEEAFVIKVAKSKIANYYKKQGKIKTISIYQESSGEEEMEFQDFVEDFDLQEECITKELVEQILSYIKKEDEITAKIFYLYFYCEYTIEEIATALKLNKSTVKNKLYRTLTKLRKLYEKEEVV